MDPNYCSSHGAADTDTADTDTANTSTTTFGNVPTTIRKTSVLDVMRRLNTSRQYHGCIGQYKKWQFTLLIIKISYYKV
jgi:hypothetical protein